MRRKTWMIAGMVGLGAAMGILLLAISYRVKLADGRATGMDTHLYEQLSKEAEQELKVWGLQREWLRPRLVNPYTGTLTLEEVLEARQQAIEKIKYTRAAGTLTWHEMGPHNQGGRTRALLIDTRFFAPPSGYRLYAGAASGGVWYSDNGGETWTKARGFDEVMTVSSIVQNPTTGEIYVGTGEYFAAVFGAGDYGTNTGHVGWGIYKSTDGETFQHLPSTAPTGYGFQRWAFVNALAFDRNGTRLFAGTYQGLMYSDNGGQSWQQATDIPSVPIADVKVTPTGRVIVATRNRLYVSDNNGNSFVEVTSSLPSYDPTKVSRLKIAVGNGVIYLAAADNIGPGVGGGLYGVYRYREAAGAWELFAPGSFGSPNSNPELEPCCILSNPATGARAYCQGIYDLAIGVSPHNQELVLLGGIIMLRYAPGEGWNLTSGEIIVDNGLVDLHVDHHDVAFHPNDPNLVFVANDGGVWRSTNAGRSFVPVNKYFQTTQFYAMDVEPYTGWVVGGTQDNGSFLLRYPFFGVTMAYRVRGGDGNYCAVSAAGGVAFANIGVGEPCLTRISLPSITSTVAAPLGTGFFDNLVSDRGGATDDPNCPDNCPDGLFQFVSPLRLWADTVRRPDTVWMFALDRDTISGARVIGAWDLPIGNGLGWDSAVAQMVPVVLEHVPHMLAVASGSSLYIGLTAMDPLAMPVWYLLGQFGSTIQEMEFSSEGNCLFVVTLNEVWRFCGLRTARWQDIITSCSAPSIGACRGTPKPEINCTWDPSSAGISVQRILQVAGVTLVGLGVSITDANRVAVTVGGYGTFATRVYYSSNALAPSPTFTNITGDLPPVPVYDAIPDAENPNVVYVATEVGVWSTSNPTAGATWVYEGGGAMDPVPVFMIDQVRHPFYPDSFVLFAGTHGRGILATASPSSFLKEVATAVFALDVQLAQVRLYPNPARGRVFIEFGELAGEDVFVRALALDGRQFELFRGRPPAMVRADLSQLAPGTYMVYVGVGNVIVRSLGKLVVY